MVICSGLGSSSISLNRNSWLLRTLLTLRLTGWALRSPPYLGEPHHCLRIGVRRVDPVGFFIGIEDNRHPVLELFGEDKIDRIPSICNAVGIDWPSSAQID